MFLGYKASIISFMLQNNHQNVCMKSSLVIESRIGGFYGSSKQVQALLESEVQSIHSGKPTILPD